MTNTAPDAQTELATLELVTKLCHVKGTSSCNPPCMPSEDCKPCYPNECRPYEECPPDRERECDPKKECLPDHYIDCTPYFKP